jgi:surface protein
MFNGSSTIYSIEFSKTFNTSKIQDMSSMFALCNHLTSLTINFDTSEVKYMNKMFYQMTKLIYLDISTLNTNNVENMENMFYSCMKLTSFKNMEAP